MPLPVRRLWKRRPLQKIIWERLRLGLVGAGFRVLGFGLRVGFWVVGNFRRSWVLGSGFWVWGFEFWGFSEELGLGFGV